ncbi:MAG TPA: tail fiber domain-containing protein [Candidatus Aminicenantes bacterium]|nr:tail fiber domain-containing protein [Candidatus Aminicenantes bacterium]HOS10586.1 tail fiber domain-containing protein [Candidatus Aminicenantes bacterium]HPL12933.1 tail fiber domain-containing protein [Candidatus Aminicenantes bacterium]HQH46446.1 tail fiber domain-containing protein [Candidatus Aminicenantes bacterium]
MKKGMGTCFFLLVFMAGFCLAERMAPIAVSPGLPGKTAVIKGGSPTFSWTAVSWAPAYKVAVFEAMGENALPYESMAVLAPAVLVKEIPGRALSWTPTADERLADGGTYVWYVGATAGVQVCWSEGCRFIVLEEPLWGVVAEARDGLAGDSQAGTGFSEGKPDQAAETNNSSGLANESGNDVLGMEGPMNTFYGLAAGVATTGIYNSFFGRAAGFMNVTGYDNTFMGHAAGYSNGGNDNTFVGNVAGRNNTGGYDNTFVGSWAGQKNTTGYKNTFVGRGAGQTNGANSTYIGHDNTFLGFKAGTANTVGRYNVFAGASAGQANINGVCNAFFGWNSGSANTTGSNNTNVGVNSGRANTTGYQNTYVGANAGYYNVTGYGNTFVGSEAGYNNTAGKENVFLGDWSGHDNAGSRNVFVGNEAGMSCASGSRNVFIGNRAGYYETGSNKLYIANDNGPLGLLIYGDFSGKLLSLCGNVAIQTQGASPTHLLDVGIGGAYCDGTTWVDGSSREFKENIVALASEEAMQAFEALEPVKFNYKANPEETRLGFIAEDVPALVATNGRKGLSAMDVVAMLTKIVQEQMKTVREQKDEIEALKRKIEKLENGSRMK